MNPTKLVLGARYTSDVGPVWALSPSVHYQETIKSAVYRPLPTSATKPRSVQRPPLEVITRGLRNGFGLSPIMGADPEVFISKNNKPVPAFLVLPDKAASATRPSAHEYNWFWDGFQAETLLPALDCHTSFAYYWWKQLLKLREKDLKVYPGAVWRVPDEALQCAGEAQVGLGCSPSLNAYGMSGRAVENPRALRYRFAGGHLHFGADLRGLETLGVSTPYLVKTLDRFLGVPSVAMAANYDSPIRRRYYGLAGEYRTPEHGLEYRTLSNWFFLHPQSLQIVLDLARHAFNLGRTRLQRVWIGREELVRDVINYNDVRSARELMKLNKEFYDTWLMYQYGAGVGVRSFWTAVNGGIEEALTSFGDVEKSWAMGVTKWAQLL